MKTKDKLIESIKNEIDRKNRQIENVNNVPVNLISEAFPEGRWSNTWIGGLEFCLPYRFELVDTVKNFMAEQFPDFQLKYERQHVWDTSKEAGFFMTFRAVDKYGFPQIEFDVALRTGEKGTTCVLNQIGTKEVPVYEVTCADGAKEFQLEGEDG